MKIEFVKLLLIFVLSITVFVSRSIASKVKFPYFSSLGFNKVDVRSGPGMEYPIKWIYVKKNLPVKVIGTFNIWKKIRDVEGGEGWVRSNVLKDQEVVIITSDTFGYKSPNIQDRYIMKIDKFIVLNVIKCDNDWCYVKAEKHKSWVQKKFLWGKASSK
ncbi:hypothetical protein HL033_02015 [Neoehrlichia mikurensis]|uniref:SH3b domain-containing protein n=1 Tax=Neoehrlichia mikurensis TaxID=89586 RepID=A0A9Q9F401_9RICK|nr:SH3 domain-containing protein [Neoehrlichia mikurensis]QXK92307.1 hypothetical protein IAH97_02010 [Neoehrlichia mikurensis]QXK92761.1 hypothetical protein HUN61_02005 [Neoehrlichia mikurensis]QXK94002.1 hypothetical protein HL033_02015 [Neoehrlichia mikurensis]UTO55835.1 hypothetical protein LUA82_02100 [Neoehrlichia mikurensis]UTO56750.1 hypothetical protein LUA81_02080 [Neoehrlichia mikurensis]